MNNSVANGALAALALLYGKSDYLNSLNILTATDDRTDADINGDNVGSGLGAMHGLKVVPSPIISTLNGRIYGKPRGPLTHNKVVDARISDLASRIAEVDKKLLLANGAVAGEGSILIPQEVAKEQPLEWFDINDYGKLWNSAWSLSHARRGGAGATYLQWGDDTPVTFPRDTRPCRLEREGRLPSGHPELALTVGSAYDRPWRLQAFVNNEALLTEVISKEAPGAEPQSREYHWI